VPHRHRATRLLGVVVEEVAHQVPLSSRSSVACSSVSRPGTRSGLMITESASSWDRSRRAQAESPPRVAAATMRTSWRLGCRAAYACASAGSSGICSSA
jgi:hypothetical protein